MKNARELRKPERWIVFVLFLTFFEFGLLQALDQVLFVAPGRFADDMGAGNGLELFAQFRSTSGRIGQFDLSATQMHLERGLSDINSDIDGIDIYIHRIDVF